MGNSHKVLMTTLELLFIFLHTVGSDDACVDQDVHCLDWAVKGRCTSDFDEMRVLCRATCNLCSVPLQQNLPEEVGDATSVPLMFSGQYAAGREGAVWLDEEQGTGGEEVEEAKWVGGDVQVRVYQPVAAGRCYWADAAPIWYEVMGEVRVPEQGVVVLFFEGKERDILPIARGEFLAYVRAPGTYVIRVTVENHERTERYASTEVALHVSRDFTPRIGPPDATPAVLHHTLAPSEGGPACSAHFINPDELSELRRNAAKALNAHGVASHQPVYVVEIGACDGHSFDPIHEFMVEHGWSGLLVEPLPDLFERLKNTYAGSAHIQFANVAVTDEGQECVMLRVPAAVTDGMEAPEWVVGIASFFHNRTAVGGVGTLPEDYNDYKGRAVRQEVNCTTLPRLFEEYGVKRVDVFQVDAEAYDAKILAQLDLARYTPHIVGLEMVNLEEDEAIYVLDRLGRAGYVLATDGRDLLAVRS